MKRFVLFLSVVFATMAMLTSCSQEDNEVVIYENNDNLKTQVDLSTIAMVTSSIDTLFSHQARGTTSINVANFNEVSCKSALAPLVESGALIRNEVLAVANSKSYDISQEELSAIKEMDDATLAELAYIVGVIENANNDDLEVILMSNSNYQRPLTTDDYVDCFSFASGFSLVSGLYGYFEGTAACMTVSSAIGVCRALVGRTLGWVGVAIVVYDFTDCLITKRNL